MVFNLLCAFLIKFKKKLLFSTTVAFMAIILNGFVFNNNLHANDLSESLFANEYETNELSEPDPFEKLNRAFFGFNRVLDSALLRPLAVMYDMFLPSFVHKGVDNFIDNFFTPLTAVNHILQGNGESFMVSICRFAVNTVFGFFGLFDVVEKGGMPSRATDFSQTLASWGVSSGPYLMLPLLGPSSFRGASGSLGDCATNPFIYIYKNAKVLQVVKKPKRVFLGIYGLDILNRRSKLIQVLEDISNNSPDPYVTIRSMYFQKQKEMDDTVKKNSKKG
jgi:phospholipid-binding lipoprotein MlaA